MIQKGDGTFERLYELGLCPKCRGKLEIKGDLYICAICKMEHKGVVNGNRIRPKNGAASDQQD